MKNYIFAGNGRVAVACLEFLQTIEAKCIGLVVHPLDRARCRDALVACVGSSVPKFEHQDFVATCAVNTNYRNAVLFSVYYGYIFPSCVLDAFFDAINLHPSFLPYCRGAYTNVWSIIDQVPAGVTLHRMTACIDGGDILFQMEVPVYDHDTGESLYIRLEDAAIELFQECVPFTLSKHKLPGNFQNLSDGTYHYVRDVESIDLIDLEKSYKAQDLINLLRARTFGSYRGAYFLSSDGRKVFCRIQLEVEESVTHR